MDMCNPQAVYCQPRPRHCRFVSNRGTGSPEEQLPTDPSSQLTKSRRLTGTETQRPRCGYAAQVPQRVRRWPRHSVDGRHPRHAGRGPRGTRDRTCATLLHKTTHRPTETKANATTHMRSLWPKRTHAARHVPTRKGRCMRSLRRKPLLPSVRQRRIGIHWMHFPTNTSVGYQGVKAAKKFFKLVALRSQP